MMFKIEKGVPVPDKYRWEDMEVSDSVYFAINTDFIKAKAAAHAWSRKHRPIRFITDKKKRRIWRIK